MKNKVNKNEFFERVARKNNMDPGLVRTVFDAMTDEMTNILCDDQNLSLTGFGMFALKPHKGHHVQFEAKTDKVDDYVVLRFTASDVLMSKIRDKLS